MRPSSTRHLVLVTAVTLVASCTSSEPAPQVAEPTTSVQADTTTTTTEPAAPEPQRLRYSFEGNQLTEYDYQMGMSIEAVQSDLDEEVAVSIEFEGTLEHLILPTPRPGTFEFVPSVSGDGSITVHADGTTMTQDLGAFENDYFGMGSPLLVTETGQPAVGRTGAPAYSEAPTRILAVLDSLGPTFGSSPLDVGDSWTHVEKDGVMGAIAVHGVILDRADSEAGSTFSFELTVEPDALPATIEWGEAVAGGWVATDMVKALGSDLHGIANADITFEQIEFQADGVFDPVEGLLLEYNARSQLDYRIDLHSDRESQVAYRLETTSQRELTGTGKASTDDMDRILETYAPDPFQAATRALPTPPGHTRGEFAVARLSVLFEKLSSTRSDLVVAGDFARFTDPNGDSVDVAAITNGGSERGDPMITWGLAAFWSGEEPRIVDVGGRPAAEATVEDDIWTIWASDTHTYVAIGLPEQAASVIGALADMVDSYRWQTGDCLDFSEHGGARPHAPFGEYGLVHCASDHQYEVLHSESLSQTDDAAFPDDLGFKATDLCVTTFIEASGVTPLRSTLEVVSYYPDPAEWERGARYVACLSYLVDGGETVTARSRFDPGDDRYFQVLEPGMCFEASLVVPCSERHSYEIVSVETYEDAPDQRPDDVPALFEELGVRCAGALATYGVVDGPASVMARALTNMPYAWDVGNRFYYCAAYAADADEDVLAIVGELTRDWNLAGSDSDA